MQKTGELFSGQNAWKIASGESDVDCKWRKFAMGLWDEKQILEDIWVLYEV